ncbi:MAG: NADH-quinone oxidoreductase subunit L [Deltaproteobacteria bacterium]|nr:NADH-quinone oxidoreductase subunit L [Deltaproteobacteria bacterium]
MDPIAATSLRWIPLLPLLGAIVNGLAGKAIQRRMGKGAVAAIAVAPVVAAFALSLAVFVRLLGLEPERRALLDVVWRWLAVGSLRVDVALLADPLSTTLLLVVTGIGGLIHLYSTAYMRDDDAYWRFFAYLNLFTFAMLVLVLADNLLLMFVGWEGVGFCSWALIGFWWREPVNTTAGNKAFIVNRIGDAAFVLGVFTLFWALAAAGHGTVVFREVQQHLASLDGRMLWGAPVATLVTLLLFVGATGKSAQIPLHVWLPDAMQGPTPVSALIHAATMVTAGVYMIARLHFLYALAPTTLAVVAGIGAATALGAATIGLVQDDIKRVLAYSTVSQLGYMFLALGVGAWTAGVFHLVTHAFFKACLFLGAGSVIHALHHEQDMRKMGALRTTLPVTFWTFLIAALALAGTPLTAGFFSKDEILWRVWSSLHGSALLWTVGVLGAGLTACYACRQVVLVFFGASRVDHHHAPHVRESPAAMTGPLALLAAGSLLVGFLGVPEGMGGANRFAAWLAPVFAGGHVEGAHTAHAAHAASLEWTLMAVSVAAAAGGALVAYLVYQRRWVSADAVAAVAGGAPYRIVLHKYWLDEIYWTAFGLGVLRLARLGAWFDARIIDGIVDGSATITRAIARLEGRFDARVVDGLVNGLAEATWALGGRLRRLQTGNINAYLYVVVGTIALVLIARLL